MGPHDIEQLVAELQRAADRARAVTGRTPQGIRLVEPEPDRHWCLCSLGDAVLCLDGRLEVATDRGAVRRVAACALLVEHAETLIDAAELTVLAGLAERTSARIDDRSMDGALAGLAGRAAALAVWREAPARAIASLPQLDVGVRLHDGLRTAWEGFVEASEPLVARQNELPGELVDALRDLEQAAGRARAHVSLASELAAAIGAVDAGAEEIAAFHATPLHDTDG